MDWKLDDRFPIWSQLQEQLTRRILSGRYPAGERLPSVRELSSEAGVNPNTMQRALAGLDAAGLTVTNRTAGRTVTEDASILEGMRSKLAEGIIRDYFEAAAELGFTKEEAVKLVERSGGHERMAD